MSGEKPLLLVGDNPFHGISHLSQERSRTRGDTIGQADFAAGLVALAVENGADGFMFTVSETTLSILEAIRNKGSTKTLRLYAIVPYAYEYVRLATQLGGISGLARKMAGKVLLSMNMRAMASGVKGVIQMDPASLLKTYIFYEISRIRSKAGKQTSLDSILLHEIITEMALTLDMDWLIRSYIEFMLKLGMKPGFETRNFAYLVKKFDEWNIDFGKVIIATPFNKVGFQMNPSKVACEEALASLSAKTVIAMSILAAGYVKMPEAAEYIIDLPNLNGIVIGVSKERHAKETFNFMKNQFGK